MIELPTEIKNAVNSFSKLPGIGEKSAFRLVMSLLKWNQKELEVFSKSILDMNDIKYCKSCSMFSDGDACSICLDESRKGLKTLCVVESASDLMAIERGNEYRGQYQILGGVLNPLLGIGPEQINLERLKLKVQTENIETVILALNPSVEGDATCSYIKQMLPINVSVERIGFGIPIGGSLEFLDTQTISKALENRKSF